MKNKPAFCANKFKCFLTLKTIDNTGYKLPKAKTQDFAVVAKGLDAINF